MPDARLASVHPLPASAARRFVIFHRRTPPPGLPPPSLPQVGHLVFEGNGLAKRGVLVRHLAMPGLLEEGKSIVHWLAAELGRDTFLNIMPQYSPAAPMLAVGEQRSRYMHACARAAGLAVRFSAACP
jgi:hypothetical protein